MHTAISLRAHQDSRVELRGVVPDMKPVLDNSAIALAPYYYGDGVKLKVLTALARGIPVVTTSLGITNTRLKPSRQVLIADAADSFADCVLALLESAKKRASMGKAGLEFVRRHYASETAFRPYQLAVLELIRDYPREGTSQLSRGQNRPALVN